MGFFLGHVYAINLQDCFQKLHEELSAICLAAVLLTMDEGMKDMFIQHRGKNYLHDLITLLQSAKI